MSEMMPGVSGHGEEIDFAPAEPEKKINKLVKRRKKSKNLHNKKCN